MGLFKAYYWFFGGCFGIGTVLMVLNQTFKINMFGKHTSFIDACFMMFTMFGIFVVQFTSDVKLKKRVDAEIESGCRVEINGRVFCSNNPLTVTQSNGQITINGKPLAEGLPDGVIQLRD